VINFPAIRKAAGRTQAQVSDALGMSQGGVSRMERQSDWLLSTLTDYLEALDADAELIVRVNGQEITVTLTKRRKKKR
jgi:transcriptional regulator with XRE-family HTH domain